MKLICLEDFLVESFGTLFCFHRGEKYQYHVDVIDWQLDEQPMHKVNGIHMTLETIREKFLKLEDHRDLQLDCLIE